MAAPIHLVLYGTLIPDLRTLHYSNRNLTEITSTIPNGIFLVDRFLRGKTVSVTGHALNGIVTFLYRASPIDAELVALLREYPGSISAELPPSGTLSPYLAYLPDRPPSHGTGETILVARQIDRTAETIRGGGDAILYETAARLRRELELRGELTSATPTHVHGVHGG